jgi:predicted  nucleic acid-binding Zn-ribbon protein
MSNAIGILRELHRLRRHIKGLQEEINRIPIRIKAQQARLTRQEDEIKAEQDGLKHTKTTIRENEGTLKQSHQQIAKFEGQLREITSKKEYDALQHEIADARKKCAQIEDVILDGMAKAEEQTAHIPTLEKALKAGKDELVKFEASSKERVATLTEELQRTQALLKEVEATLPDDVRPTYQRLVTQRGEDALSLALKNTCSACHSALTEQQRNDLMAGRLVLCKSCGRIVYLADEAA